MFVSQQFLIGIAIYLNITNRRTKCFSYIEVPFPSAMCSLLLVTRSVACLFLTLNFTICSSMYSHFFWMVSRSVLADIASSLALSSSLSSFSILAFSVFSVSLWSSSPVLTLKKIHISCQSYGKRQQVGSISPVDPSCGCLVSTVFFLGLNIIKDYIH